MVKSGLFPRRFSQAVLQLYFRKAYFREKQAFAHSVFFPSGKWWENWWENCPNPPKGLHFSHQISIFPPFSHQKNFWWEKSQIFPTKMFLAITPKFPTKISHQNSPPNFPTILQPKKFLVGKNENFPSGKKKTLLTHPSFKRVFFSR